MEVALAGLVITLNYEAISSVLVNHCHSQLYITFDVFCSYEFGLLLQQTIFSEV